MNAKSYPGKRGPDPNYSNIFGAGKVLAEALDVPQAVAARYLGITPGFICHLIHGRKKPGRKLAIKIKEIYGVPVDLW